MRKSFDFKPHRNSSKRLSIMESQFSPLREKNIVQEYEQIKLEADYRQKFSRPTTSKVTALTSTSRFPLSQDTFRNKMGMHSTKNSLKVGLMATKSISSKLGKISTA